jgi:hypothetical protein
MASLVEREAYMFNKICGTLFIALLIISSQTPVQSSAEEASGVVAVLNEDFAEPEAVACGEMALTEETQESEELEGPDPFEEEPGSEYYEEEAEPGYGESMPDEEFGFEEEGPENEPIEPLEENEGGQSGY